MLNPEYMSQDFNEFLEERFTPEQIDKIDKKAQERVRLFLESASKYHLEPSTESQKEAMRLLLGDSE